MPAVSQKLFAGLKPRFQQILAKTTEAVDALKKPDDQQQQWYTTGSKTKDI